MDENIREPEQEASPLPLFLSYTLVPQEIYAAVKTAQYRRSRITRIAQTVALSVIFLLYLEAVWVDPTYIMGIMLSILSLFVLASVWLVPLFQARSAFKKATDMPLTFELDFGDEAYSVKEAQGENTLYYHETEAVETNALILLIVRKSKLFCIPKRAINEMEFIALQSLLTQKLKDDYKGKR